MFLEVAESLGKVCRSQGEYFEGRLNKICTFIVLCALCIKVRYFMNLYSHVSKRIVMKLPNNGIKINLSYNVQNITLSCYYKATNYNIKAFYFLYAQKQASFKLPAYIN